MFVISRITSPIWSSVTSLSSRARKEAARLRAARRSAASVKTPEGAPLKATRAARPSEGTGASPTTSSKNMVSSTSEIAPASASSTSVPVMNFPQYILQFLSQRFRQKRLLDIPLRTQIQQAVDA